LKKIWNHFRPSVEEVLYTPLYWILGGLFAAYWAIAGWLLHQKGFSPDIFGFVPTVLKLGAAFIFLLLYLGTLSILGRHKFRIRPRALCREWMDRFYNRRSFVSGIALIMLFEVFFSLFVSFKKYYPAFVPFYADPALSALDRTLHFGQQPWEWMAPLLSSPAAVYGIDFFYALWFAVKFLFLLWLGFSLKKPEVRATFFLTYFISWILLGTIVALAVSSAGPCYFDVVYKDLANPYGAQMDMLRALHENHKLVAVRFQQDLWNNYINDRDDIVTGISAFPSMHVAVALMYLLAARVYSRGLAFVFLFYFVVVQIGSVLLGWHYAVDGYFSVGAILLLWAATSWFVRRFEIWKPVKSISA
jgi:hypothetical protein